MNGNNALIVPFILNGQSKHFKDIYPSAENLKNLFETVSESERHGIIRLWITEGIPYAFKDNPLLYEEMRSFISKGVSIHPKEVTLVGSARIGYSLKKKVWGKSFTNKSDLDFTIVSNELYKNLVSDFQKWIGDYAAGKIIPLSKRQNESWLRSIATTNENIPKGYINTKDLFSHNNYVTVRNCYSTMTKLKQRLDVTNDSPSVSDASVRVYSSWKSCTRQLEINFKTALDLWAKK